MLHRWRQKKSYLYVPVQQRRGVKGSSRRRHAGFLRRQVDLRPAVGCVLGSATTSSSALLVAVITEIFFGVPLWGRRFARHADASMLEETGSTGGVAVVILATAGVIAVVPLRAAAGSYGGHRSCDPGRRRSKILLLQASGKGDRGRSGSGLLLTKARERRRRGQYDSPSHTGNRALLNRRKHNGASTSVVAAIGAILVFLTQRLHDEVVVVVAATITSVFSEVAQ